MNCKRMIPLQGLKEDEAWGLFQKHVGAFDDNSDSIKGLAQEITKKCGGLPVAIAAIASTLKEKPQVEWEEALKTLRDSSPVDIEEDWRNPYTCLRLSYDKLENKEAKSLFLLCSIFPEDYEIPIDELTIIGVALGFVKVHSYQRARNQLLIKGKNKLIDSCLLLDGVSGCVKMHDLVQDVGLWIAKKENKFVEGQLKEDVIKKENKLRYLWIDEVEEFPYKLDCPKLEFLHVSIKPKHGLDVPNDIFKGMEMLKVFMLSNHTFEQHDLQLPISFHLINNLRYLSLKGWILGDISFIGSLKRLESLKLWRCSFDELPKLITQQKNLRLLDIMCCEIQRNPYEVMGRCSKLEVLYFSGNIVGESKDHSKDGAEFFEKIKATPTLESYCIDLGDDGSDFERPLFPITKSLYVKDVEKCMSNATIKDLMQRAEVLYLRGIHRSCKNIIPHTLRTIGGNFDALTQLTILHSDTIECVIDISNHWSQMGIISNLTKLTIKGLKNLRTLYRDQLPSGLFAKLEFLKIHSCDLLEHIIVDEVKEIVANGSGDQRSVRFAFSKLKTLRILDCGQLEFLMPVSYAHSLAQLECLSIAEANKLKSLFSPSIYEELDQDKFHNVQFLALNTLILENLPNMVSICQENYHLKWPSLKDLTVRNVPQLKIKSINRWIGIYGLRKGDHTASEDLLTPLVTLAKVYVGSNNEMEILFDGERLPNNRQPVNTSLRRIELEDLLKLRHIWRGPKNSLLLQNIVRLDIERCENLRVILPASILTSLPKLKRLNIVRCNELEGIMEENDDVSNPYQLVFPNLTMIIIRQCHKLKRVFPFSSCLVLPKLRALLIEEASQLEQVPWDMIPNVEYVLLWKLPTLSPYQGQHIDFQSVRYLLVQQCPKLPLTSTVNLQQLVQILDNEKDYWEGRWRFHDHLRDIIQSNEDCVGETTEQIDSKESEVESASRSEHIAFGAQNNEKKSEERVEGSFDESSTSKNVTINAPSTHSDPTSSFKSSSVASLPIDLSHSQNKTMPGMEILTPTSTNLKFIAEHLPTNSSTISHETNVRIKKTETDIEDDGGGFPAPCAPIVDTERDEQIKVNQRDKNPKIGTETNPIVDTTKEELKKGINGRMEGSTIENANIVTSSIRLQPASSLQGSSTSFLPKALPHEIKVNRTEKEIKTSPIINLQGFGDHAEQLATASVPVVFTTKDESVVNALADLEVRLKMPLKDIANSEPICLRLLTAFKFLSCLSFEEGPLSLKLKAITESLLQEFPSILHSYKVALATVKKFPKFIDEAQEKEVMFKEHISKLEKEMQYDEAKTSSLQEKKEKCVVEIREFKKECESMRKQKS
ncbi:uncharacterized protein LOC129304154 isoform X2 [Prosopis cineraria]|uniref:uncharacterized protein LOC129304154 isoform X2 n=1 Tax=Prosopis cineraria TaxID=364024 RepID=UPI00241085DF|nr:uncharacterized protein LOC129304154 isoform X2 [Prosopis cineraria]